MSLTLSKKNGLNPSITFCPICGRDGEEIALLGNMKKYICEKCDAVHFGRSPKGKCSKCGTSVKASGEVDGNRDRIPSSSPCKKCAEILERTSLSICAECGMMFEVEALRATEELDMAKIDKEQALKEGKLEIIKGKVFYSNECSEHR